MSDNSAISDAPLEPWRSVPALADALNGGHKHATFSVPAIRNQLARRNENGLAQYVRKVGNKLIVSEPGYNRWLAQQYDPAPEQLSLELRGGA